MGDGLAIKLSFPETQSFWEIPVLFEDQDLLAINKPAGLTLVPDPAHPDQPDLISLLHAGIAAGKPWAQARGLDFLMNAYRLDAETSGVLLLARSKTVLSKLTDLFGSEKPLLTFLALVSGSPAEERFTVDAKIGPDPRHEGIMKVDPAAGKRARTSFEVVERFRDWTLVRATPLQLRSHQVRVHSARARLPLAGDSAYRGKPLLLSRLKPDYRLKPGHTERPLLDEPCVHAAELKMDHPVTGATLAIEAPWPKNLLVAMKYLRQYAAG